MNDIDLMVGILLEKPSDGAIVGPTTQCIIADAFYRYKAGDRFFYDVQGQPGSFTKGKSIKYIKCIKNTYCLLSHTYISSCTVFELSWNMTKYFD